MLAVSWMVMTKKTVRKDRKAKKSKRESAAATLAKKRWVKMTPEQRSEHARRMSIARWQKTPRKEEISL